MRALAGSFEELRAAVESDRSRHPDPMPLDWTMAEGPIGMLTHEGIRSEREVSVISGGEVVRWLGEPVEMEIPVLGNIVETGHTRRPEAYYVPAAWLEVINRLTAHGIEMERILEPQIVRAVMYRTPNATLADEVFEGHIRVNPGELVEEERDLLLAPGSYIIRTDQPLGDLAMLLLEPRSTDSFFQWGFFL